jgi:hypothetical protein
MYVSPWHECGALATLVRIERTSVIFNERQQTKFSNLQLGWVGT